MDQYTPEFTAKGVDGQQLLNLDSDKLKALGVSSQSDRSTIKKKLKDMRKAQEKQEKQREKREKEVRRSGRLPASTDSVCWGSTSLLIKVITSRTLSKPDFILLVPWCSCHMILTATTTEHSCQECTCANWGASCDLCSHCSSCFFSYHFFRILRHIFSSNYFNWTMGNSKKLGMWPKRNPNIFYHSRKLEAIIIKKKKVCFRGIVVVADHAHIYLWKSNVYCFFSILYFC